MFEANLLWFLVGILSMLGFVAAWIELPRFWHWLRFSVWYDYRYAQGYRKGMADGRAIARRDTNV